MSYSAVRIPATRTPSASIIFLHGLGDSGSGWAFLAEEARRQKRLQHVNFVFPNAPTRPVTLNFGMAMPAWYDIPSLGAIRSNQDEKGIMESVETLKNLIKEQQDKGIPLNRIVIGGFSQGCAVSLAVCAVFLSCFYSTRLTYRLRCSLIESLVVLSVYQDISPSPRLYYRYVFLILQELSLYCAKNWFNVAAVAWSLWEAQVNPSGPRSPRLVPRPVPNCEAVATGVWGQHPQEMKRNKKTNDSSRAK